MGVGDDLCESDKNEGRAGHDVLQQANERNLMQRGNYVKRAGAVRQRRVTHHERDGRRSHQRAAQVAQGRTVHLQRVTRTSKTWK